jgi:hypothetical protein
MKRLVLAVALIVSALGLVACGGGGSSTSGSTSASGIEPASERLEHTEEGCAFSEEQVAAHPSEPVYEKVLAECKSEEKKLRQMVDAGEGDSTKPVTSKPKSKPKPKPKPEPEPVEPPEPTASPSQENALASAESYLEYEAFSKSGLEKQLKYEGYSAADAKYGAAHTGADWNEQAAKSAKSYLEYESFSESGLIQQLEYEGYSSSQAEYGVSKSYH